MKTDLPYLRQTLSAYATDGEELRPPREGYHLKSAALIGSGALWALIWEPDEDA